LIFIIQEQLKSYFRNFSMVHTTMSLRSCRSPADSRLRYFESPRCVAQTNRVLQSDCFYYTGRICNGNPEDSAF